MFLSASAYKEAQSSFLHACGDVSLCMATLIRRVAFSPRMWRCFHFLSPLFPFGRVFSTHVEMFLVLYPPAMKAYRFLHACGDVSMQRLYDVGGLRFSPRMWRCFHKRSQGNERRQVFSTHVEMFPSSTLLFFLGAGFLHACGDVSDIVCPSL